MNRTLELVIAQAPDWPTVEEFAPELVARALIELGTTMLASNPPLTVVPDLFAFQSLRLTFKETLT